MDRPRNSETVALGTATAAPGTKTRGTLSLGNRPDGSAFEMPVFVINGVDAGPVLWVQGCIHGDEYDTAWAVIELVKELDPQELKGALIAIPVLNVGGFQAGQRTNPLDGKDLNRVFPGSPTGTVTEQIAAGIIGEVMAKADYLIDLHGGGSEALQSYFPLFHYDPALEASRVAEEMSRSIGSPVIWRSAEGYLQHGLFTQITQQGIPAILIEYGGEARLRDKYATALREGIKQVMRYLHMLPGDVTPDETCTIVDNAYFINTTKGGFFRSEVEPMQHVTQGQVLDRIYDVFGDEVEVITAPSDGIVFAVRTYGTCHSGSVAHVFGEIEENQS